MSTIHTMSASNVLTLAELLTRADAHGAPVRVAWDDGLKVKVAEDGWTPPLTVPERAADDDAYEAAFDARPTRYPNGEHADDEEHPEHAVCADACGIHVDHEGPCLDRPGGRIVCGDAEHFDGEARLTNLGYPVVLDHDDPVQPFKRADDDQASNVVRYLLVELTLPDGSQDGDEDPERVTADALTAVDGALSPHYFGPRLSGVEVTQVYPGDIFAEEDLVDFDTAEAAGFDGTLRDGKPAPTPAEAAAGLLAAVLGDAMTAQHVGGHFTCSEAENIAHALIDLGKPDEAATFLAGHAMGDDDPDDDPDHVTIDNADDPDAAARDYLNA